MDRSLFPFQLCGVDASTSARVGEFHTPHGIVPTPTFMPVGTLATVKGIEIGQLRETGARMVLANTYHLTLRPGEAVVQAQGGLHDFMGWDGPILTDSGGFQIFSLAKLTKVGEQAAVFRAHTDGRLIELSPEAAVQIQQKLGSDVAMVLDQVVSLPSERSSVREAAERTVRWAARCLDAHERNDQALFGIVQGGLEPDLRTRCAEQLVEMDFPGYAIGGLSVGESPADMYRMLDVTCPALPDVRPRYLMGVGRPEDLLESISRGVDLFDCVMPTRNGRNALAFTDQGTLRLRNAMHGDDSRPLEADCPCVACKRSRSYLRHLFMSGEMLGPILLSIHNLTYYQRLIERAAAAIRENRFREFKAERMEGWSAVQEPKNPSMQ